MRTNTPALYTQNSESLDGSPSDVMSADGDYNI